MCTYCNNTHTFLSAHTTVYVCPQCHHVLERGIVYEDKLPEELLRVEEDMTVFKLGTVLLYQSVEYTFIGRFQYFFNSCVRNKWLLRSASDELIYLIEQAGFYGLCKEHTVNLSSYELSSLAPGYEYVSEEDKMPLFLEPVYLESLFQNHATRMEGELCKIELNAKELIAADFTNEAGGYAFAQVYDKKNNTMLVGEYHNFINLQLTNTRLTDEWK